MAPVPWKMRLQCSSGAPAAAPSRHIRQLAAAPSTAGAVLKITALMIYILVNTAAAAAESSSSSSHARDQDHQDHQDHNPDHYHEDHHHHHHHRRLMGGCNYAAGSEEKAAAALVSSLEMFVDELPRMPIVRGYVRAAGGHFSPAHLTIGMYAKTWRFHRDLAPSRVFAYGRSRAEASVPGPTIEAMAGVKTYVRWENHLPDRHILAVDLTLGGSGPNGTDAGVPTVVHLHGGASEPGSDGHALAWFTRGFTLRGPTWTKPVYEYANVADTSSLWYHDHADAFTRLNLLAGLVGAYTVVRPELEHDTWKLPRGRFEAVLLIQDRAFTKNGHIFMNATGNNPHIHPQWQPEYFGDVIVVNGKAWPYMRVERRKYRFRIINASNARYYRLALKYTPAAGGGGGGNASGGLEFVQIGADSFYLAEPVRARELLMAPSEIADVIIDFSAIPSPSPSSSSSSSSSSCSSSSSISSSSSSDSSPDSSSSAAESGASTTDVILTNDASYPYPNGNAANERNSVVMKFVVAAVAEDGNDDAAQVPARLVHVPRLSDEDRANVTSRDIIFTEALDAASAQPTRLLINFRTFADPVTETPRIGSTEMWRVINLTPDNHPLHIHLVGFQVLHDRKLDELTASSMFGGLLSCVTRRRGDADGCRLARYYDAASPPLPPPPTDSGFKNVYKVPPFSVTSLLVRFALADGRPFPFDAAAPPGYAYHCHILNHEDNVMIRPYVITR